MIVTEDILDTWTTESAGPVALHLKQKLLPVEAVNGDGGVIFPPTYADIGYNIDLLSDGTRVASIDSVGSQANRLEPTFKARPGTKREEWLVPQIEIVIRDGTKRSILDLAHRAADAVVQSSPDLAQLVKKAFEALQRGDAGPLCVLAPTSLVFGVWDSRGGSGEKRPRLVRSIIRAWDVERLSAAAQFNSIWKALDEEQRVGLEKEAKAKKTKLSEKGFHDAPGVFRKTDKILQYRDGVLNPEARVLGGVFVRGRIEREVTVNLVALRGLRGESDEETSAIRKYLLGLSLTAATADVELFLREGCHLRYADEKDVWYEVPRRGAPTEVVLDTGSIKAYAMRAAEHFRPRWPSDNALEYKFDLREAKKLLAKKTGEDGASGES